ncbi:cardioactive peptide [Thrips palmi]|uniref:Cardioactive peptide n=1 Tax=Thrips palmi TaxID=161013 RepID=A0A6P8ZPS7_THRPL|nr:cardioactive peptide [Thrips palmi]
MQLYLLTCCSVLLACWVAADDVIMPNTELDNFEQDDRPKRPFCNAFTGCGKKRAVPLQYPMPLALPMARALRSDDSMSTLIDLNAEPAVAELSRQILSEAKLWETMQEAREELERRQHKEVTV